MAAKDARKRLRSRNKSRRRAALSGLRGRSRRRHIRQRGGNTDLATNDAMIPTTERASVPADFTFDVSWASGARATEEGAVASMNDTQASPGVSWTPIPNTLFTLIVWDPDAAPESRAWLHWLITNIHGNDLTSGQEIVPWAPPTPPAGTGTHRYIFGLFQQEWHLSVSVADRPLFNPKRFAEMNGLRPIGYRTTQVSHDIRA